MIERGPTPEIEKIEYHSALAAYVIRATLNASSELFGDDLQQDIYAANHTTAPIPKDMSREEYKTAIASSDIIRQVVNGYSFRKPISLRPRVSDREGFYNESQDILQQTGVAEAAQGYVSEITKHTAGCMSGNIRPAFRASQVVAGVWMARGRYDLEVFRPVDMLKEIEKQQGQTMIPEAIVAKNGDIVAEVHDLPQPTTFIETVPYYDHFFETKHGQVWLASLLHDVMKIKNRTDGNLNE